MMPVMTGFELAMAIRQTPSLSALPICLMTGAQAAEASAHPELFDVIFGKPFNIEQVVQKVREFAPPVPLI
jgi:CheY-like chemotaxis protein